MSRHFSEDAAAGLDALLEGWTLHGYFMPGEPRRETVLRAARALTTPSKN